MEILNFQLPSVLKFSYHAPINVKQRNGKG